MKIIQSDITKQKVDCIINPANGLGIMDKGVSKFINRAGGPEVQNSAKASCFTNGLYKPGQAFIGSSGFLEQRGIKAICHAVIIYRRPSKTKIDDMLKAIESSIVLIRQNGYKSFAIPSMGIEPRNIDEKNCGGLMMQTLWKYKNEFDIHVVDTNEEFIKACKTCELEWTKK